MPIQARLQEDLKQAMRDKDTVRRSVLRYLRSEIHNEEIAKQTELDDDGIIVVLTRQAQQRRDSIELYESANRQDLVDKEKGELAIIFEYMPQQMSREEIIDVVRQAIEEAGATGPGDMGKVMGRIMPQVRGKTDGKEVSSIVSEELKRLADAE
ncbi:MAG: GatB/YqeY domain-containing protein [Chloroflexi bacterium]|nr:GatB/YqeY domain-containing protein [Chloroflexota bacterium]